MEEQMSDIGYPSVLWEAANRGDLELLKQELSKPGVDMEVRGQMRRTPLMEAAKYNHADCVGELLLAGANPCCTAHLGSAIDYTSNPEIRRMLNEASVARDRGEKWVPGGSGYYQPMEDSILLPPRRNYPRAAAARRARGKEGVSGKNPPKVDDVKNRENPNAGCGKSADSEGGTGGPAINRRCRYFPQGKCHKGDACPFKHVPSHAPSASSSGAVKKSVAKPPSKAKDNDVEGYDEEIFRIAVYLVLCPERNPLYGSSDEDEV